MTLNASAHVTEPWVAKGVALRILRAVDTKSAVLFVLVLVVCALFLGQAALASVRSRRTEIGTLRCLGWSGGEVLRLVLGELAAIGLAAGAAGAILAYVLGRLLGQPDAGTKSLLVLPAAFLLATCGPDPRLARHPAGTDGSHPAPRGSGPPRPPGAFGGRSRHAQPAADAGPHAARCGRARTGRGRLHGTAGPDTGLPGGGRRITARQRRVAQARGADYVSVALSLLLGAAGAVDVLIISQRERATDLAVLRATGWTNANWPC